MVKDYFSYLFSNTSVSRVSMKLVNKLLSMLTTACGLAFGAISNG
jgi:hypothetical protein